jgi:flagellar motor switch protein FliN/FliY
VNDQNSSEELWTKPLRLLVEGWVDGLAQAIAAMTDSKPEMRWETVPDAPATTADGGSILWWQQAFQPGSGMTLWVGAPRSCWEYCGSAVLKAAGIDQADKSEVRSTWLEILSQSLSTTARQIGSCVGREITCGEGAERGPVPGIRRWAMIRPAFDSAEPDPIILAISPELAAAISSPPTEFDARAEDIDETPLASPEEAAQPLRSRTMDLLLDLELPVSISFGKKQLPMKDVLKLTTGSIVELDRGVNEAVEVLVNNALIARGEVVVVEGNYGVRIQEIASRQERLRNVR